MLHFPRQAWFHTPPLCERKQDPKRRYRRPPGRRSRRQPSARRPGRGQGPRGLEAGSGGWPPLSKLGRRPPCVASVDRHPEGRNRAAGSGSRRRRRVGRGPKGTPSAIQPFRLQAGEELPGLPLGCHVALLLVEAIREHRQQPARRPCHCRALPQDQYLPVGQVLHEIPERQHHAQRRPVAPSSDHALPDAFDPAQEGMLLLPGEVTRRARGGRPEGRRAERRCRPLLSPPSPGRLGRTRQARRSARRGGRPGSRVQRAGDRIKQASRHHRAIGQGQAAPIGRSL